MMKILEKNLTMPMLLFLALLSCSSGEAGGETIPQNTESNLVIDTELVGSTSELPNGNGTGVVNFKIISNNAISFKVVFGDGETLETKTGVFTHTYSSMGTKSFQVQVSAFNGLKYFNSTKSVIVFVASNQIWGDEFDIDGAPDPNKWKIQIWDPGHVNDELQSYTNRPENIIIKDGILKITAIKEKYGKGDFTSSRIESDGKFTFKYGKIVIRAKLPTGVGTWPAVWMLGENISSVGWPACGEIDILESVGKELNVNHSSLHSPGRSGNTPDTGTIKVLNDNTEFHIYTAEWRSDSIKFYVDDKLYYTFSNNSTFPFNEKFFLIINFAMGGSWGGPVDPNFTSSTLEVDYIRVYN